MPFVTGMPRGEAVQNSNTNLELHDLTVDVPRHNVLAPQFHAMHFVSMRLQRWSPLHRRQSARPRYFDARRASVRATAPAVTVFHGFAFLHDGMLATAPWVGDVLISGDLGQQIGQHGGVANVAAGDLDRPDFQRLLVDPR